LVELFAKWGKSWLKTWRNLTLVLSVGRGCECLRFICCIRSFFRMMSATVGGFSFWYLTRFHWLTDWLTLSLSLSLSLTHTHKVLAFVCVCVCVCVSCDFSFRTCRRQRFVRREPAKTVVTDFSLLAVRIITWCTLTHVSDDTLPPTSGFEGIWCFYVNFDHTEVTSWLSYVDVFNIRAGAIAIPVSNDLAHVGLINFFFLRTVEPAYNDICWYDTSPITSDTLLYQLIPHC
jgi:hypothetical protein